MKMVAERFDPTNGDKLELKFMELRDIFSLNWVTEGGGELVGDTIIDSLTKWAYPTSNSIGHSNYLTLDYSQYLYILKWYVI